MKNINLMTVAAAALMLSSPVMAKNHNGGGFEGPSAVNLATVEQVKNMKDDAHVVLRGNIESHLGGEKYMFKDSSGSIKVEIDDDDWNGVTVKPGDLVEIKGEVDTHLMKPTEIDVDSISLVK